MTCQQNVNDNISLLYIYFRINNVLALNDLYPRVKNFAKLFHF